MSEADIDSLENVEVLDKLFQEELDKWHKEQIDPSGINVNMFYLDAQFHALFDFLVKEGIIEEDKANLFYKKFIVKRLREFRKQVVPEVRKQRLQPNILLDPNGKPFMN